MVGGYKSNPLPVNATKVRVRFIDDVRGIADRPPGALKEWQCGIDLGYASRDASKSMKAVAIAECIVNGAHADRILWDSHFTWEKFCDENLIPDKIRFGLKRKTAAHPLLVSASEQRLKQMPPDPPPGASEPPATPSEPPAALSEPPASPPEPPRSLVVAPPGQQPAVPSPEVAGLPPSVAPPAAQAGLLPSAALPTVPPGDQLPAAPPPEATEASEDEVFDLNDSQSDRGMELDTGEDEVVVAADVEILEVEMVEVEMGEAKEEENGQLEDIDEKAVARAIIGDVAGGRQCGTPGCTLSDGHSTLPDGRLHSNSEPIGRGRRCVARAVFKVGDRVQARRQGTNEWCEARIVSRGALLGLSELGVHFFGWASRNDESIALLSAGSRIREPVGRLHHLLHFVPEVERDSHDEVMAHVESNLAHILTY